MSKNVESKCPVCQKAMMRDYRSVYRPCFGCSALTKIGKRASLEARAKQSAAMMGRRHSAITREKLSKAQTGVPCVTENSKRFSKNHASAVECFFRSPSNVIHYCKSITVFAHENPTLFQEKDLILNRKRICNAIRGLSSIHTGKRGTWKGWTLAGEREGRERFDLLGRNHIEE